MEIFISNDNFLFLFVFSSMVIDALKGVESERRCFRMIGGVLVERTVKDVLPALENNKEQVGSSITVGTIISSVYTLLKKMYT